jgi:pantoate--beta-alanine ligase
MKVSRTIHECRLARYELGRVAFVPTMGALHEGHLALMRKAKSLAEHVAVSIFVNPTQFGPREDFTKYPRPIESDLEKCRSVGVDMVFHPSTEEIYGGEDPKSIILDVPHLTEVLEGKHRPGHFRGVCQVVAKLFNIVQPDFAVFGLKDYQQFCVIRAMTAMLNFPIEVVGHPTVREPDGLAMSSRNQYLSSDERKRALSISRALRECESLFESGVVQTSRMVATMQHTLLPPAGAAALSPEGEVHRVPVSIDYFAAVDARTLQPIERVDRPTLLAIAARVGSTRLIDNTVLVPRNESAVGGRQSAAASS